MKVVVPDVVAAFPARSVAVADAVTVPTADERNGIFPTRLAVINAAGADTLYELYHKRGLRWDGGRADLAAACHYYDELDRDKKRAQIARQFPRYADLIDGYVLDHEDTPAAAAMPILSAGRSHKSPSNTTPTEIDRLTSV